jgi:signal transduction histidine kinase
LNSYTPQNHEPCAEIIEAHETLKSRQTEIIQAEKIAALGEMTAGLIHELNSPLSAIHNALDVSIRGIRKVIEMIEGAGEGMACKDERDAICRVLAMLEENHATASDASERMNTIVGRLKRFTALDEPRRQLIDVRESINNTVALLGHELPPRIRLTRNFQPVPRIVGDPSEMSLVFWNVIKNAAQSIDGDGDITVSTRLDDRRNVVVEITDDGRGIEPDKLPTLFSPSFTTHKSAVRLNTGLPICYNILRRSGGEISIDSTPGEGTTVTIRLPPATIDA